MRAVAVSVVVVGFGLGVGAEVEVAVVVERYGVAVSLMWRGFEGYGVAEVGLWKGFDADRTKGERWWWGGFKTLTHFFRNFGNFCFRFNHTR